MTDSRYFEARMAAAWAVQPCTVIERLVLVTLVIEDRSVSTTELALRTRGSNRDLQRALDSLLQRGLIIPDGTAFLLSLDSAIVARHQQ